MTRSSPAFALLLVLTLAMTGCSADEDRKADDSPPDGPSSSSGSSTSPPEAAPTAEQILVADQPYVSPCRLFPPADAAEVFQMDGDSNFSERGRAVHANRKDLSRGILPRIETRCSYSLPDASTVNLVVEQFSSEESAQERWLEFEEFGLGIIPPSLRKPRSELDAMARFTLQLIKEGKFDFGAVPMPGLDKRILWREGNSEFIATTGNLLLTFQLTDGGPAHVYDEAEARLAEDVLIGALERAEEPRVGAPIGPWFETGEEWLDPCALLDDEALEALFPGHLLPELNSDSTDQVPHESSESATGRSARNSCERKSERSSGSDDEVRSASLEVLHVAPQDDPEDVVDSDLALLAFKDSTPSPEQVDQLRAAMGAAGVTGVDASYIVKLNRGETEDYLLIVLLEDYILTLDASTMRVEGSDVQDASVSPGKLLEATQIIADNVRAAVG